MKLNKTEKRAFDYCVILRERLARGETPVIQIDWKKSATWGANPHVYNFRNEDMVKVSGCGYCKLSTALAEVLRFLPETEEGQRAVWTTGGMGENRVCEAVAAVTPYILKPIHHTETSDSFMLCLK